MADPWNEIKAGIEKRLSAADAIAKRMDSAEVCSECGAIVDAWSREKHKDFHAYLTAIAAAQERLNRAARSFVKVG